MFSLIVDACPELVAFVELSFDSVKFETSSEAVKGKITREVGGLGDDKPSLSKIYGTCIFKNIDPGKLSPL